MVTQKRSISIYRQLPTAVPSGTPISTNIRSDGRNRSRCPNVTGAIQGSHLHAGSYKGVLFLIWQVCSGIIQKDMKKCQRRARHT